MASNKSAGGNGVSRRRCLFPCPRQNVLWLTSSRSEFQASDSIRKLEADTEVLRQEAHAIEEATRAQDEAAQLRKLALVGPANHHPFEHNAKHCQLSDHMQRPATINSIEIHGAKNTRKNFLDPIFQPLVHDSRNVGTTLGDVLAGLQEATTKLERFGMLLYSLIFLYNFKNMLTRPSQIFSSLPRPSTSQMPAKMTLPPPAPISISRFALPRSPALSLRLAQTWGTQKAQHTATCYGGTCSAAPRHSRSTPAPEPARGQLTAPPSPRPSTADPTCGCLSRVWPLLHKSHGLATRRCSRAVRSGCHGSQSSATRTISHTRGLGGN